ncbi:MAG: acyltransferase family protein [Muribaculaceae bacterium]
MKARESQFELLRIIAMAMIIMVHFNGIAVEKFLPLSSHPFSDVWGAEFLESFAIIGVNLFVLISGYFGIRLSAKGVTKYVGWVLWYSILLYLVVCCFYPQLFLPKYTEYAVNGITHSSQWFVTCYFMLMALSPAINAVLARTTFKQHLAIAAVLFVVNCLCGWWFEMVFNQTGYTVYHMVFIYWLGRVLRECMQRYATLPWCKAAIGIYVVSLLAVVWMMQDMRYFKVISYNNPLVVVESLAFFTLFATMHFHNRAINWIASSAFAVYLIHMHFSVYPHVLRPLLSDIYDSYGGTSYAFIAAVLGTIIYAACVLIDKPREWLFNHLLNLGKTDSKKTKIH